MLKPSDEKKLNVWLQRVEALDLRFPVAEITRKTGFNKGHVSGLLKRKIPLSSNFLEKFNSVFPENPIEEPKQTGNRQQEMLMNAKNDPAFEDQLSMTAIVNLTEANKMLAEAQKLFAESNLTLSRNNEELIGMVKTSSPRSTEIQRAFDAKYADLLELLADVASGKRYKSKQEVLALLSNMLHVPGEKNSEAGTQKN